MKLLLVAVPFALSAQAAPLLLSPLVQAGQLTQARNESAVTTSVGPMGHSGFFTVPSKSGKQNNNIFFWFQPCSDCDVATTPVLLWMQGGPGGPGTFGAFGEIGNWYVDKDIKLQKRCYNWCEKYNCIFVDQPVVTGFSFPTNSSGLPVPPKQVEYTRTSADAAEQVYGVLQQFFTVWPEYRASPFWITGESYGGLYTSNMGKVIVDHNAANDPKLPMINLKGIAVGDPVMNLHYQLPTYADTLYGMGVIMADEREQLRDVFQNSLAAATEGNCQKSFDYWNSVWNDNGGLGPKGGLYYTMTGTTMTEDVLLPDDPDGLSYSNTYLTSNDTAKAFHYFGIPGMSFSEGGDVYNTMVASGDFCQNSTHLFAQLFHEHNLDILIYSSTSDPLLGPPTTEAGVQAVWDYVADELDDPDEKTQYYKQPKVIWKVKSDDRAVAGYSKCYTRASSASASGNRFCYNVVRNAGHMTPSFQPRAAYDLVNRFIDGKAYDDSGQDANLPACAQCGGVAPFAGQSLPECVCGAGN